MGRTSNHLTFYQALEDAPYEYDFFQTLRRIECLFPGKPRLGAAQRPADEPLRLGQDPSMAFAPATFGSFAHEAGGRAPRLGVAFFGLIGPQGPLPLHLTEFVRDRLLHHGDRTLARFFDLFNHRFLELFYRAWAQAQPTVNLDRPETDRFAAYVGSTFGIGTRRASNRDDVPDHAKLFFAGLLARQARNPSGLAAMLTGYFRVPVAIEEYVGHWMQLPASERTRLGRDNGSAHLGAGAVLGRRVWDRQNKFRVWLGPLSVDQYEAFLPGGSALRRLVAWVRQYFHFELEWDVRLTLKRDEVPQLRLGRFGRLGWTTWVGRYRNSGDAGELTLDPERLMRHGTREKEQG